MGGWRNTAVARPRHVRGANPRPGRRRSAGPLQQRRCVGRVRRRLDRSRRRRRRPVSPREFGTLAVVAYGRRAGRRDPGRRRRDRRAGGDPADVDGERGRYRLHRVQPRRRIARGGHRWRPGGGGRRGRRRDHDGLSRIAGRRRRRRSSRDGRSDGRWVLFFSRFRRANGGTAQHRPRRRRRLGQRVRPGPAVRRLPELVRSESRPVRRR